MVSGWWTPRGLAVPLAALVLCGLLLLARRQHALVAYVGLSFAAICATPFQTQFVRYLLPLYPFLALAMFTFLARVPARVRLRWPALPQALVSAVPWAVLAVVVPRATIETLEIYASHHQQVSYVQHGRPISYRLFYYGLEGVVLPPFEVDGRKGQRLIDSVPVKYLIESTYLAYWRFTTPLLAANPQAWRPVWRGPNGTVVIHERVGAPQP